MEQLIPTLTALVAEMAAVVKEMCEVLRGEREALDRYDSDGLNRASAEKSRVLARLDELDAERQMVLQDSGVDAQEGMAQIEGWRLMLDELAVGRDLNRENGEIVSERLRQVRRALSMLNQMTASSGADVEVYSPKGLSRQRGGSSTLGKA
ncbi:flagella synthesis protein FlgN [Frateuria aurantia]